MRTKLLSLVALLLLPLIDKNYALEVPKLNDHVEQFKALLNDFPVMVREEDNSVGVIVEDLHNFPLLPNLSEISTTRNVDVLTDFSNPEPDTPIQQVPINLEGVPTLVPLVEFQRKLVENLRACGKNPIAVFEPSEQIVVTPDNKETTVNLKFSKWKIS